MSQTILSQGDFTPLAGWPCAPFLGGAPSIADTLTTPSADDLLPQVLALVPRGAAWGSDEYGDGQGASPNQLGFWTAVASWSAASYARDADIAAQAFPSLVTWSLDDWESEYGLPDPCITDAQSTDQRLQALRAKFALIGASSPNYLICLAASLGYTVWIEEYNPLRCYDFRAGDRCFDLPWGDVFEVHAAVTTESVLRCDLFFAGDRLATWGNSELECAINTAKQPQTLAFFSYDLDAEGAEFDGFTLDDGAAASGDSLV
jgi:uncharacterized protein YmfQ (DUF2313 family)